MNRHEALQFIRDNSRLICSMKGCNPLFTFEHRLGDNGRNFILLDMGKDGWTTYFDDGVNNFHTAIHQFCQNTGVSNPISKEENQSLAIPTFKERIEDAVNKGEYAFWEQVAKCFPECTTGDFDPHSSIVFDTAMKRAVNTWWDANKPE